MSRYLVPPQGNPLRPAAFLLAIFFGAMLILIPGYSAYRGESSGSVVAWTLVLAAIAAACFGPLAWLARRLEPDLSSLASPDAWASWWLTVDEYNRFAASERRRALVLPLVFVALGIGTATCYAVWMDDRLSAGVALGVFLFIAMMLLVLGAPPWRATDNAREVRIGPRGVQALGRYTPLSAIMTRMHAVHLKPGNPAMIIFEIQAGQSVQTVRIPVAGDRWDEAEALVSRFMDDSAHTGGH